MSKSRRRDTPPGRLSQYRPAFDRTIFILSLLGFLVVVHLGLQDRIGFSRGCLGFTTNEAVEDTFNCELVTQSEAGTFLGLSNTVWGLAFYAFVAFLSAAAMAIPAQTALLKRLRAASIVVGFVYALSLVGKQIDMGEYCALCLTSAAITAALFVTVTLDFFRPNPSTQP